MKELIAKRWKWICMVLKIMTPNLYLTHFVYVVKGLRSNHASTYNRCLEWILCLELIIETIGGINL